MADERYFFPASIHGLLQGLGPRATPELLAFLKEHGLDVERLPPLVPIELVVKHRRLLARWVFPDVSEAEAVRLLGLHFVRGWVRTPRGAAASIVLTMLGPRRTLTRLDRAFRTTDNFTQASCEFVDDHTALLTINEVHGLPTYWVGVLQGGLEVIRRDGTVTIHATAPPGVILRITWA
ncbi:MAG TPA: DUF2378 family protein [Archangium sp.]